MAITLMLACDILMKQKGKENVALITDCMTAGGLEDGDYMLGEFPVVVAEGTARLKSTGNLAGSILKLKDQFILMMFVVKSVKDMMRTSSCLIKIWIWLRPISMGSNVTRRRIRFKNRR